MQGVGGISKRSGFKYVNLPVRGMRKAMSDFL